MLSVDKVKNSGKTTDYFAKDDYYASDNPDHQKFSSWYGKGAQELGLEGNVTSEPFLNILEGNLPNGQKIGVGAGSKKIHDPGRDCAFSAPKSVSIMSLLYGDHRLIEAHNQAVKKALDEMEKTYFKTRVKKDGQISLETTGKMVAAIFQHELSRDLDPQLHSHAIVANATLGKNGKWRTGYFDDIYDNRNFLGMIYRAELAVLVKQLGYELTHKGNECFFELAIVPQPLLKLFSKRSGQLRELAGPNASQKELERAAILTRKNKKVREHDHNLHGDWKQEANEHLSKEKLPKFNPEFPVALKAPEITQKEIEDLGIKAVDFAIKHLGERKTVFTKKELIEVALNDTLASATYPDIMRAVDKFVEKQTLLPTKKIGLEKNTFTTAELLAKENAIIDLMLKGKDQHQPIVKDFTKTRLNKNLLSPNFLDREIKYTKTLSELNEGQKQAAELILSSKDRIIAIEGYAGVGKTFMLKAVNKITKKEGFELVGMAPTGVATRNLNTEAGINSITLQRFLSEYDGVAVGRGTQEGLKSMQQDFRNKILVVDESSMISTTQMKNLLTISERLNLRVVLVGDTKQLDAVEAGVPFFELGRNGIATATMKEIRRQENKNLKAAVYETIDGNIRQAFQQIHYDIVEPEAPVDHEAVAQFMAMPQAMRAKTMILTPANETRESVNSLISDLLFKERKQQSQEHLIKETVFRIKSALNPDFSEEIYHNRNLTEAEKTRAYRFQVGDVLLFSKDRDFLKVSKNDYCQITKIDNKANLITIQTGAKTTQTFNPIDIKGKAEKIYFEVFEERERIFRVEDKVAFTRSIPGLKIINADGGQITGINRSTLTIKLDNGKSLKIKKDSVHAKHLDHSYAVTAHKAQGLTCENVIAVCESYRRKLTSQKNFYVEISRAKQRAIIVTDSRAAVIAQLEQNTGIEISAREHQNILPQNADIKNFEIKPFQEEVAEIAKVLHDSEGVQLPINEVIEDQKAKFSTSSRSRTASFYPEIVAPNTIDYKGFVKFGDMDASPYVMRDGSLFPTGNDHTNGAEILGFNSVGEALKSGGILRISSAIDNDGFRYTSVQADESLEISPQQKQFLEKAARIRTFNGMMPQGLDRPIGTKFYFDLTNIDGEVIKTGTTLEDLIKSLEKNGADISEQYFPSHQTSEEKLSKQNEKRRVAILTSSEIKEHFLEAIKSGMTLDAKDTTSAIDKAFNKPSTKIRFGQKKEYEICWHGEAGYAKSYKSDELVKWGINSIKLGGNVQFKELTDEEIKHKQEQSQKDREQAEKQKVVEAKAVAKKAKRSFEFYSKPNFLNSSKNQYLTRKGINQKTFEGIRFTKDNKLVVPLHDTKGEIHSLQFIGQDGKKMFLPGGKKQGHFFMIDQDKVKDSKTIYLAEGFATAATINIATGKPVAASFDAGNIEHVLKNLKTTHPNKEFIIAADNDLWKEHNVGREKAELAAQKYGAKVMLPNFTLAHKDEMPTDFNDLHKISGIEEVRRQLSTHHIAHEHSMTTPEL